MKPGSREINSVILAMFAAVPLYTSGSVSVTSVVLFHSVLGLALVADLLGLARLIAIGERVARVASIAYVVFFPFDAIFLSHSLIRSSIHLLFFIGAYQAVEKNARENLSQRLLVAFLIFITSIATSTSLFIVLFILGFGFLCFRQLMLLSHLSVAEQLSLSPAPVPVSRAAATYLVPTVMLAGMFFPLLPRIRSPFVGGFTSGLERSSTGISDTIDFTVARSISPDPAVVARVSMAQDAVPFFTPLRLRGAMYDAYDGTRWRGSGIYRRKVRSTRNGFVIARRSGFSRDATVIQTISRDRRIFLPNGTYLVRGISHLEERPYRGRYSAPNLPSGPVSFQVHMSRETSPLEDEKQKIVEYPFRQEVATIARQVAGVNATPRQAASKIERYLLENFTYVPDPAAIGRAITVDEFLLVDKRGHCEYFAAGMVVMLSALDIPSRIVGGFYGGEVNPLTGHFILRKRDAHAWVEVFDGTRWVTYDPTPPALRPGSAPVGVIATYWAAVSDSVNYFWDRYILTFGLADQIAILSRAFTRVTQLMVVARQNGRWIAGIAGHPLFWTCLALLFAIPAGIHLWLGRPRTLFGQLSAALKKAGFEIQPEMTVADVLGVVRSRRPDLELDVRSIAEVYTVERFSPRSPSETARSAARDALARLRGRVKNEE